MFLKGTGVYQVLRCDAALTARSARQQTTLTILNFAVLCRTALFETAPLFDGTFPSLRDYRDQPSCDLQPTLADTASFFNSEKPGFKTATKRQKPAIPLSYPHQDSSESQPR